MIQAAYKETVPINRPRSDFDFCACVAALVLYALIHLPHRCIYCRSLFLASSITSGFKPAVNLTSRFDWEHWRDSPRLHDLLRDSEVAHGSVLSSAVSAGHHTSVPPLLMFALNPQEHRIGFSDLPKSISMDRYRQSSPASPDFAAKRRQTEEANAVIDNLEESIRLSPVPSMTLSLLYPAINRQRRRIEEIWESDHAYVYDLVAFTTRST